MSRLVYSLASLLAATALCALVWVLWPTEPRVVLEATTEPTGVIVKPPFLPRSTVAFADSERVERVPVRRPQDVAATITVDSDSTVRLLIDYPRARWFPEVSLKRPVPIRVIGSPNGVTVVQQRLPILALEFQPFAGAGFPLSGIAGATVVRVWMLHGGAAVAYPLRIGPVVSAQVRDRLFVGAMYSGEWTGFVSYGF